MKQHCVIEVGSRQGATLRCAFLARGGMVMIDRYPNVISPAHLLSSSKAGGSSLASGSAAAAIDFPR